MRTFQEMQEGIRNFKINTMKKAMQELEKGGLRDFEEKAEKKIIENCQDSINNIEEVTTIEIGATTNSIISAIQKAYQIHLAEYWQDFEGFINEYVLGTTLDGNYKKGVYFAQNECFKLGIGINELMCFKGQNPMNAEPCDIFKKIINANYGTCIPMSNVEQQALKDYENVAFGFDDVAKDEAYIRLKEIQRDSGTLKNGGSYYLLANNLMYQEAKSRCANKSI